MSAYQGVRILDFTQGVPGPMAAMLMADFEAEVVKIEPPGGDRLKDHPGYLAFNRNKQVMQLDLDRPADLERARALIALADVALFDHAPGELERLGLDAQVLTAAHPSLIHVWTPPYGTGGDWSRLPAHHSLLTALSGVAFRQGAYSDQPIHLILPLVCYGQAVTGAAAIGAALLERARSGLGQAVIVSGLHGVAEVTGPVRVVESPPLPRGSPLGATPSYRLYQCGDGQWLFLGTLFANFYAKAVEAIGLGAHWDELVMDPLLAREALAAVFLRRPRAEWLEVLKSAGAPCAPVGPREAWFDGTAVAQGNLRVSFPHPELGEVSMPNTPIKLSANPGSVRGLAEACGGPDWTPRPSTNVRPDAAQTGRGPLHGVRVLDLGTVIAGAHAGGILANLGADVIKVEPIDGDPFRSDGGGFLAYNRGKRGLGLDLKQPAAVELFLDLARQSDVVLDNYRFGVRQRLGIDYAALKAVNPRIISCSINAYGETGDRARLPGFDPLLQAEGGMMAAQGGEGEPILHTIPVNDVATAAMVAFGVIAALNAREASGQGQEVLTSLMAQSLTSQLAEMTTYAARPPNDVGDCDCVGVRALHRYYLCGDGAWLGLVCERPEEVEAVGRVLSFDLGDAQAALAAPRGGALARTIAEALTAWSRDDAVAVLLTVGVAAAPALRGPEALESQWLWDNGLFEVWKHPRVGDVVSVRAYADFGRSQAGFAYPTPDLGEHSAELLREMGVAEGRIDALFAAHAVFGATEHHSRLAKSARPGDGGVALATQ
ncbi:MAG TPA: CoA transferase [Caulobacteraceae bacterium]|nr:CoA transferase [Caulobacteraceae bacterium]